LAVFAARFQLVLQYRAAALAGFATQCWWGALKVMIYAAFFAGAVGPQPITFAHTVSYTWLGQGFLAFLPWSADPDVAEMVRSGAVAYERLRPVDTYGWWYARAMAWSVARVAPRAALMFILAGVILPLAGLGRWSLHPPAGVAAGVLFTASMAGVALVSASMTVLLDVIVAATLTDRGANILAAPLVNVLSGAIIPLAFFPAWMTPALRLSPFAALVDTPFRIWFGELGGAAAAAAIGLQFFWAIALAALGRWWLGRAMTRLQVQGG
jgi:ABC-2 type transport system permease protein